MSLLSKRKMLCYGICLRVALIFFFLQPGWAIVRECSAFMGTSGLLRPSYASFLQDGFPFLVGVSVQRLVFL